MRETKMKIEEILANRILILDGSDGYDDTAPEAH